jgi:hypothetical protein
MRRTFIFDVDQARAITGDGREPVELDPDDVQYAVAKCEVDETHVPHVDPSIPGIVSHVYYPAPDGQILHGHVMIDGHHRAARSLQLGRPFLVYLLTESESKRIVLRRPRKLRKRRPRAVSAAA